MTLGEKVAEVDRLFLDLDAAIAGFQHATSLHCKSSCGRCCFKADIEATALEFLPFAAHLYQAGQAAEWYDRLTADPGPVCLVLNPSSTATGLCSQYAHRGLICRLFGYSARTNKYGARELVTCNIIKTEQAKDFEEAATRIAGGLPVPVMSDYYRRLSAIDPDLSKTFYPINEAIREAIAAVRHYYAYREPI